MFQGIAEMRFIIKETRVYIKDARKSQKGNFCKALFKLLPPAPDQRRKGTRSTREENNKQVNILFLTKF